MCCTGTHTLLLACQFDFVHGIASMSLYHVSNPFFLSPAASAKRERTSPRWCSDCRSARLCFQDHTLAKQLFLLAHIYTRTDAYNDPYMLPQGMGLHPRVLPGAVSLLRGGKPVLAGRVGGRTLGACLLYTSPSPRDKRQSRMPSSA